MIPLFWEEGEELGRETEKKQWQGRRGIEGVGVISLSKESASVSRKLSTVSYPAEGAAEMRTEN